MVKKDPHTPGPKAEDFITASLIHEKKLIQSKMTNIGQGGCLLLTNISLPKNSLLPVGVPNPMNPENQLTIICRVANVVTAPGRPDGSQGLDLNFIQACSITGFPPLCAFLK